MQTRSFEAIGETLFEDTLPNGLQLCVVPKKGFRSTCAVLTVRYGGACRRFSLNGETRDTPAGVAHYLEHKLFDLPEGDDALERLTANGADPNASTDTDKTAYYFSCSERFEENLRLLLHLVFTPYFTEETVEKERGIITQEIRMGEDDPDLAAYYRMLRMLYAAHPLRERVAGTVESIRPITAETLTLCHRAFYTPANMVLCVEGDVDPERVRAIIMRHTPQERQALPAVDYGPGESLLPVERFCREEGGFSAKQFLLGTKFRAELTGEASLRQRLTAILAVKTLLGRSSPFFLKLYDKGLLDFDYDCELSFDADPGYLILNGECRDPEAVLEELKKAVAGVRAQGLDPRRFERAKRASLGARLRGLEDFHAVCFGLASGTLADYCVLDAQELLNGIGKADCERFLLDALQDERLALAIFEPKRN